jgi:hypothetical protein
MDARYVRLQLSWILSQRVNGRSPLGGEISSVVGGGTNFRPAGIMNSDQATLYERAGELARRYHESKRQKDEERIPPRPRSLFSTAIEAGFNENPFSPQSLVNARVASFANRMGMLAQVTRVWKDEKALVRPCSDSQVDGRMLLGNCFLLIWNSSRGC